MDDVELVCFLADQSFCVLMCQGDMGLLIGMAALYYILCILWKDWRAEIAVHVMFSPKLSIDQPPRGASI